ncbi:MAG: peptide deformylase, partial [Treponema sp.]|nr:peptide deformylase [Treponema sp.]
MLGKAQGAGKSLTGTRKTTRFNKIEVEFSDTGFEKHVQEFTGHVAQIIQHECDHLDRS